jgi:hypothetical protein
VANISVVPEKRIARLLREVRVARRENGAPFEFTERTTEELISELHELGYTVERDKPPSEAVN